MTDGTHFPAIMRYECLACGREFEATGRARMFRRYCDNVCSRWANSKTGRRIMAERMADPPIPEDVYRRFPILGGVGGKRRGRTRRLAYELRLQPVHDSPGSDSATCAGEAATTSAADQYGVGSALPVRASANDRQLISGW